MAGKESSEITLDQFLLDLRRANTFKPPWSYAWVLGSGAAFASGVPTGRTLAQLWLRELFRVRHPGRGAEDFSQWNAAKELNLAGLDVANPAPFYGALYKLRFGHQPKLGQDFLRSQILARSPSYGYSALAQIQRDTPHRCVVTTNFDHLLEEAYRRYLDCDLVVCGSDDQASTLQRLPDEPLLVKIHGDIFHETKNDPSYIAELREQWHDPLRTLFKRSAPLFIGYGGNDPDFMNFLVQEIRPGWFPHKPVWAYRQLDGRPAGSLVQRFEEIHEVLFLGVPGFDEFLFLVAEALDLRPLTKHLEAEFASRLQGYQEKYDSMAAALRAARPSDAEPGQALDRSLAPAKERAWWEWSEAARNAPTYVDGLRVLDDALRELPDSPELQSFVGSYRSQANASDEQAETMGRRAVEIAEQQYGMEHPGTLTCVSNLAHILAAKGDSAAAEPLYRRALDARERLLGSDHPDTLSALNNLAHLLAHKGDRDAAESLYRRALESSERTRGSEHPDTVEILHNLAHVLLANGDYRAAELAYRRTIDVCEKALGPDHSSTLTSLNSLANLLVENGDREGAGRLYRRVLNARERVLGPEHRGTISAIINLAILLAEDGDLASAEQLYRRATDALERSSGPKHRDTAAGLINLANLLSRKGDTESAESLYRSALETLEEVLGAEHPDTLSGWNNLGALLIVKGDRMAGEAIYRRTLEVRERVQGSEHPDTLKSLNNLALLLGENGDRRTARELMKRAASSAERTLGPDHVHTKMYRQNLWSLRRRI